MKPDLLKYIMLAAAASVTSRALVRAYSLAPAQCRVLIRQRAAQRSARASALFTSSSSNEEVQVGEVQVVARSIVMGTALGTDEYSDIADDVSLLYEEEMEDTGVEGLEISSLFNERDATTKEDKRDMRALLRKELRRYRLDQSAPLNRPAYTVFPNAVLDEICASLPTSENELLAIKGIGNKKLELYGDDILTIVRQHVGEGLVRDEEPGGGKQTKGAIPRPAPITVESLTKEQRQAAEMALDTENPSNVFITGAAGTGKSHVSKFIIQTLQEHQTRKIAPTAPTGVAAIHVGGSTLHSFFGIGLGNGSVQSLVKKVRKNKEAMRRIDETDALLIDEVSMLSSDLLEKLDAVVRGVRKGGKLMSTPMGGLQIIAIGDFFQLPPIVQRDLVNSEGDRDEQRPFCFDSPVWSELGLDQNTFELAEVQRQESGSKFEMFLNMVRVGDVTLDIIRDFNKKCLISEVHPLPDDGIVPTRLYTHNRDVDAENETRLSELKGKLVTCKAADEWREKMPTGTLASVKKSMKASLAVEMPDGVQLKVGAQVMLTRNKDLENGFRGLVNGSRGVVERFVLDSNAEQIPVVRFDNGRVEKVARVEAIRYNPDGGPGALVRRQIPLKLAWASTVHKSQGSTLTRAILDISGTFEPGQAYVSLSRVKNIKGLFLERPVSMDNIIVSKRVLDYYNKYS